MLFLSRCKGNVFEDGDLIVDLHRRTVQIDKNELRITEAEYNLLRVLILTAGRLLTHRRLNHEVWGKSSDEESLRMLRTTIGTLREKLELDLMGLDAFEHSGTRVQDDALHRKAKQRTSVAVAYHPVSLLHSKSYKSRAAAGNNTAGVYGGDLGGGRDARRPCVSHSLISLTTMEKSMSTVPELHPGDCVRIPDGRIGRVRARVGELLYRVRLRRMTSNTHQFREFPASELARVDCPKGWMSPECYLRYLRVTLRRMREKQAGSHPST